MDTQCFCIASCAYVCLFVCFIRRNIALLNLDKRKLFFYLFLVFRGETHCIHGFEQDFLHRFEQEYFFSSAAVSLGLPREDLGTGGCGTYFTKRFLSTKFLNKFMKDRNKITLKQSFLFIIIFIIATIIIFVMHHSYYHPLYINRHYHHHLNKY